MVLNKTNANTIAKMHGEETDDWAGKRIILCAREVEFQGTMMQRAEGAATKAAQRLKQQPAASASTASTNARNSGRGRGRRYSVLSPRPKCNKPPVR